MYIIKIANEILTTAILISMQVRPKMAEKWVEMDFPDHGLIWKVVDNGLIHLHYEKSS